MGYRGLNPKKSPALNYLCYASLEDRNMSRKEVRKEQIDKLEREIAGVDELFHEDIDRFKNRYGLSHRTVKSIVFKSGKYNQEVTIKAPDVDALQSTDSEIQDYLIDSFEPETQYGLLQPAPNSRVGCFLPLIFAAVILFFIASGVSLLR